MRAIIEVLSGPMGGQQFDFEFVELPPPARLIGSDIHRSLCGTYELVGVEQETRFDTPLYRYELRSDEDFNRIYKSWSRWKVMRQVSNLSGGFKV